MTRRQECEVEHIVWSTDLLDALWPTKINLFNYRTRTVQQWKDHLERYVDMGLLFRIGNGTRELPYRYYEVAEGTILEEGTERPPNPIENDYLMAWVDRMRDEYTTLYARSGR